MAESLAKGSRVVVVGRLQQRTWTAEDGSARSVVEVVAEELGPSLRWTTAMPVRITKNGGGGLPITFRCFPHLRHSRYQPPSGLRSRCQRCLPMRHSQGLAIVASLWVSRSGSVKAIQRVQMRESTPLLLLAYRDPRLATSHQSRSQPRSFAGLDLGSGDDDQDDAHPGPVASSTSDATGGTRPDACQRSAPSCPCW